MIIFRGPYDHAIPLMRKSGVRSGMVFCRIRGKGESRSMIYGGTWLDDTSSGDEVDLGWMMASV